MSTEEEQVEAGCLKCGISFTHLMILAIARDTMGNLVPDASECDDKGRHQFLPDTVRRPQS